MRLRQRDNNFHFTNPGVHLTVPAYPHQQDIDLDAEDAQLLQLKFQIIKKPEYGHLLKMEGEGKSTKRFRYCPRNGFSGIDYFTFIASNKFLDSNLGTVSIKVDGKMRPQDAQTDDVLETIAANTTGAQQGSVSQEMSENPMNRMSEVRVLRGVEKKDKEVEIMKTESHVKFGNAQAGDAGDAGDAGGSDATTTTMPIGSREEQDRYLEGSL
jgi:hypothetical protein